MNRLLSGSEVKLIIKVMASKIRAFEDPNRCFISILKGGSYTTHCLLSYFAFETTTIGYLGLSSYRNGTKTSGKIKVTSPLDLSKDDLRGKNLWIVDDIFDSGLTLMKAKSIIKEIGGYNSLKTAVLVRKVNSNIRLWKDVSDLPDIVGFKYEKNNFLVGSGLGKGEEYRCLEGLWELEEKEIENV